MYQVGKIYLAYTENLTETAFDRINIILRYTLRTRILIIRCVRITLVVYSNVQI